MNAVCGIDCSSCLLNRQEEKNRFYHHKLTDGEEITIPSNDHHIVFVLKGAMSVKLANGEDFVCRSSQMVLLIEHGYKIISIGDFEVVILRFTSPIQVCNNIGLKDLKPYLNKIQDRMMVLDMKKQMIDLITSLVKYLGDDITCIHLHTSKQVELFILFRYYYSLEEICGFFYKILHKDIGFSALVKKNYVHARNVKELASLCGYGLSNFKRVFSKHFQTSPYQWMLQQSAYKVQQRLLDNSIPIKSIVKEFNFASQSHLTTYCKRYLGGTPTQIRDMNKLKSQHIITSGQAIQM